MPTKPCKAKDALDTVIRKSRVHLYKPIQIAEILFHHRTESGWDLNDLESYRNISKRWRDDVSVSLVGRRSTSSQKYQDNIFDANAMPPKLLKQLSIINKRSKGVVEAYVYRALETRLLSVHSVYKYIESYPANDFSLKNLVALFQETPGLRRSIDKMYEILVYALFTTILRALKAQVTLEVGTKDTKILNNFRQFIRIVLGIDINQRKIVIPASLHRAGTTNAADRGLDIWANFGPAIQVKHLSLNEEHIEDIADHTTADRIVIVCLDAERKIIENILQQIYWNQRIQGIITINDLDEWYNLCLNKKYKNNLGTKLVDDLKREFAEEFPSTKAIKPFMNKRGYSKLIMPEYWRTTS